MYGVRVNNMNENIANENDQDANSILTELDKGLRSSKIGEQCEAIVRFPKLFEKYPFPILINSSFLKLGEFFRTGTNLLRLWVLRVCQQSEKHLDKILNVDEFIKRIFTVMHSNDPIARAITLRTIGAVAGVIPEKQQVHHAIRRALDSHDTVEVEAAIHASVQYAAQSKTFAISMCSKIAAMIESLQTPISMKIQLIPVLRHMHHDANTAALVKMLCINLLPKYPSQSFVIVILDSLTQLSCATLVDIPDQVNLLLTYLQDPRKRVRYQVLRSLQSLAEKGAHLWSKSALKSLISIARTCSDLGNEQSLLLSVVLTLTNCPVTCYSFISEDENLVLELCSTCLLLEHHTAASQALAILTSLVLYCFTEKMTPPASYMEQINLHIESLMYSSLTNDKLLKQFSQYLKCGVRLSEKNIAFGENFVELIGGLLTDDFVYPTKQSILMCETLGAICSHFFNNNNTSKINPTNELNIMKMEIDDNIDSCTDLIINNSKNKFHQLLPKLFKKLELIINENDLLKINKDNVHLIEVLSAVCLQSMLGYFINENLIEIFHKIFNVTNYWTQYRIARSASRYGHHYLAAQLYLKLSNNVSLEKLHFFLLSLFQISKAECILIHGYEYDDIVKNYNLINPNIMENSLGLKKLIISERLDKAITLYWKALATLKASSSPTHPMTFQSEFIRLRGQYLESIFNIVIARNTQCITPPPAIAQTLAQNSRDHLQKYGHVTNQLRKTVKCIKICEDMYSKLYKSAFDADPCTLEYLTLTQYLCAILGNSIETICFVSPSEIPSRPAECNYPETKYLYSCCNKIINELNNLPNESGNMKSITNKHTDVILNQIEIATKSPICIPRFFFQVLQNTSIKLSISPQPRITGEPVLVQCNSNLVVKVEGVIQHYGKHESIYRSIDTIQLTLISQLLAQRPNDMKQPNDTITLTQTVIPHRDFLTGSFLLPLNNNVQIHMGMPIVMGGQWQVTVEACVIDHNGILWNTGPKSVLMVRVLDDPTKTAAVAAAANRRF